MRLHPEHESRYEPIRRAIRAAMPTLAADERAGYETGEPDAGDGVPLPEGPDPEPVGDLRAAVADAAVAIERAHAIATTHGVSAGGELAGLAELLAVVDRAQATAVALVDRIETSGLGRAQGRAAARIVVGAQDQRDVR
ncbi:MAG TPA: hypothetical protein VK906_06360 [Egicoccus sp.]|nr:hypothetical protein [Egicoccus sp.]HSK22777.1 hypothetical protein [Egicoccus sp.]